MAALVGGVALAGVTLAQAQDVPHQRVGMWRTDMVMAGQPQMSIKSCVDEASAARNSVFSSSVRRAHNCKQLQLSHNPDGSWTSVSSCDFGPGVARTTRADVSGDFNSRLTMTMRSPPTAPPSMTMTMTWIGACEAGMRGGDVVMPNGAKMNMDPTAH
jgi:hypothetical protein